MTISFNCYRSTTSNTAATHLMAKERAQHPVLL
jgi:hypothetical protein